MPEAAEVEAVRRRLAELVGQTVMGVEISDREIGLQSDGLVGRRVCSVRRHGKRLAVDLEGGEALLIHLRMTGVLQVIRSADRPRSAQSPETRASFDLGDHHLIYSDRRRLGVIEIRPSAELGEGYGVDLLDSSKDDFIAAARSCAMRRRGAKSLMLDQRGPIAGAGNYLVDEALFASQIHPLTPATQLSGEHWVAVWTECRRLARRSLDGRAETLTEYLAPDGARGDQPEHLVCYGRAGRECVACGSTLEWILVARRGTTFCPRCQPENRLGRANVAGLDLA